MESKTISEQLFERFCRDNGILFKRLDVSNESGIKSPDYEIFTPSGAMIVEVKQLDPNEDDKRFYNQLLSKGITDIRGKEPGTRIRGKINHAIPQLKVAAKAGKPAIIALCSNIILDAKYIDQYDILIGMYGLEVATIVLPNNRSQKPYVAHIKFGGKKKVSPQFNTTLS